MRKGVVVAAIVAVVAMSVPTMVPDVVARDWFGLDPYMVRTKGPYELPKGSYTVWMEESPTKDGRWNIPVSLVNSEGEPVAEPSLEEVTMDIEGVRCYPALTADDLPAGEYTLHMGSMGPGAEMMPTDLGFFIVRQRGAGPTLLVVTGAVLAVVGGLFAALLWLGRPHPGVPR